MEDESFEFFLNYNNYFRINDIYSQEDLIKHIDDFSQSGGCCEILEALRDSLFGYEKSKHKKTFLKKLCEKFNIEFTDYLDFDEQIQYTDDARLFLEIYYYNSLPHRDKLGKGFYFHGNIGCGKTSLMKYILYTSYDSIAYQVKNIDGIEMISTSNFTDNIINSNHFYTEDKDIKTNAYLNHLKKVSILVFDDLSKMNFTTFSLEKLFEVINYRYENKKVTHFTDNISLEKYEEHFKSIFRKNDQNLNLSRSIISRIKDMCIEREIEGDDLRGRKREVA